MEEENSMEERGRNTADLQLTSWYSAREERWCMDSSSSSSTSLSLSLSNEKGGKDMENNGRDSFTRAVYLAKVKRGLSKEELSKAHEQIMNSLKAFNEAKVTGILLVYGDVVLHLLEAPSDILSSLFTFLNNNNTNHHNNNSSKVKEGTISMAIYDEVKILLSSEDCPDRHLATWTQLHVNKEAEKDAVLDHESFNDDIFEIYTKVIDVGQSVVNAIRNSFQTSAASASFSNYSQEDIDEIISESNQVKRMVSMLPSNERLMAYIASTSVISLVEYLSIYNDPISLSLDEEKTWPPQPLADTMTSKE